MKTKSLRSIYLWQCEIQMSYDIVKAHGGELMVETKKNEGTTFTIQLPTT